MQNNRILNLVLRELQENYKKYFDFCEKPRIMPVKYLRRTNSYVWKCDVKCNNSKNSIYVKVYKKKGFTDEEILHFCNTEFKTLKSLYEAFKGYSRYSVVRPLAFFPEHSVFISEEADGELLSDYIKRDARFFSGRQKFKRLKEYCFSSGEWLRILHMLTSRNQKKLSELDMFMHILRDSRNWDKLGISSIVKNQIILYFEQKLSILGDELVPMSGQHGDFMPYNILISPNKIVVYDFPYYNNNTVYFDIARFCSTLLTYPKNPIYTFNNMKKLIYRFIDGYRNDEKPFSYEILKLYLIYNMINYLKWEKALSGNTLFQKFYAMRVIPFYLKWLQKNCI